MSARPPLSRESGVSLIEVMAALAIVALMGAVAVVMLDGRRTALDVSAERLTRSLGEAREEALLSGAVIGFGAAPDLRGWAFYRYSEQSWTRIETHPAFEPVRLPEGVFLQAREGVIAARNEAETADAPQIWFDPAGFDDPFVYALQDSNETRLVARLDDGRLILLASDAQAVTDAPS